MPEKILIFAQARTGSTSLVSLLNEVPGVRILIEPFNPLRSTWRGDNRDFRHGTRDVASLKLALDEIHRDYTGFKTMAYQLSPQLYDHLLAHAGYRTVFLQRRNILRCVVSAAIAHQTKIWTPFDVPYHVAPKTLEPLDVDRLAKAARLYQQEIAHYTKVFEASPQPNLTLHYEELFEIPRAAQLRKLEEILGFLGIPLATAPVERLLSYLAPEGRMTGPDMYARVSNIAEVERALASPQLGSLYDS